VSYDAGVRKMLLQSTTASLQLLINPPYIPSTTWKRVQEIVSSYELRALDTFIADVSPFDKKMKMERKEVGFRFIEEVTEKESNLRLKWIPKVIQNNRLINVGMMWIMGDLRRGSKGAGGFVGGNMNVLLTSSLREHPKYETVILMSLKQSPVNESMSYLLNTHQPIYKKLVVGIARFEGEDIVDLFMHVHGIELCVMIYRWP
jgi:hypothetical protein